MIGIVILDLLLITNDLDRSATHGKYFRMTHSASSHDASYNSHQRAYEIPKTLVRVVLLWWNRATICRSY